MEEEMRLYMEQHKDELEKSRNAPTPAATAISITDEQDGSPGDLDATAKSSPSTVAKSRKIKVPRIKTHKHRKESTKPWHKGRRKSAGAPLAVGSKVKALYPLDLDDHHYYAATVVKRISKEAVMVKYDDYPEDDPVELHISDIQNKTQLSPKVLVAVKKSKQRQRFENTQQHADLSQPALHPPTLHPNSPSNCDAKGKPERGAIVGSGGVEISRTWDECLEAISRLGIPEWESVHQENLSHESCEKWQDRQKAMDALLQHLKKREKNDSGFELNYQETIWSICYLIYHATKFKHNNFNIMRLIFANISEIIRIDASQFPRPLASAAISACIENLHTRTCGTWANDALLGMAHVVGLVSIVKTMINAASSPSFKGFLKLKAAQQFFYCVITAHGAENLGQLAPLMQCCVGVKGYGCTNREVRSAAVETLKSIHEQVGSIFIASLRSMKGIDKSKLKTLIAAIGIESDDAKT